MPILVVAPRALGRKPATTSLWLAIAAWLCYVLTVVLFGLLAPQAGVTALTASQALGLSAVVSSLVAQRQIRQTSPNPRRSLHLKPARFGFWLGLVAFLPSLFGLIMLVLGA